MSAALRLRLSPDDFLEWEMQQPERHEYHRGEIFQMAGGTEPHARIITNTLLALSAAVDGRGCVVYTEALGVRIEAADLFTYPDLSVVCGDAEFYDARKTRLLNPLVLVEVLSPSTMRYDRGQKTRFYRQIPSLQAHVLIESEVRAVDVLTRDADGWRVIPDDGDTVAVSPLGLTLSLDALYRGVETVDPRDVVPPLN